MKNFFYRVREGDDLLSLCRKFRSPVFKTIAENRLNSEIEEGDVIRIFSCETEKIYTAGPFDTVKTAAEALGISEAEFQNVNGFGELIFGFDYYG